MILKIQRPRMDVKFVCINADNQLFVTIRDQPNASGLWEKQSLQGVFEKSYFYYLNLSNSGIPPEPNLIYLTRVLWISLYLPENKINKIGLWGLVRVTKIQIIKVRFLKTKHKLNIGL